MRNCTTLVVLFLAVCFGLVVFPSCLLINPVGASSVMWNQTYGGNWGEIAYSVVEAHDGGYALAGYTHSFGAGNFDFWLVKTDAIGNVEWNQTYGGLWVETPYSLVATSDGGYALAGITDSFGVGGGDFWLVKTDGYGNLEWNQTYGGSNWEKAYSLVETFDGGFALAGETKSFGAGDDDCWLVKTDAKGNLEWSQSYGGEFPDGAYSLVQTSDEGFAFAGYTHSFGYGDYDAWLVKTDKYGQPEWNQTFGSKHVERAYSLVATDDGGFALTCTSNSLLGTPFWLIKTDDVGNKEWRQTHGDGLLPRCLIETSDNGFAVVCFGEASDDRDDIWLFKTDSMGYLEWNQTYAETENEMAYSVIESSDGGFVLAGYKNYNSYDPDAGWVDFLLIKTNEQGEIPEFSSWAQLFFAALVVLIISVVYKQKMPEHNKRGAM